MVCWNVQPRTRIRCGLNRSADWLHQAQADLDQALVSARAGHHEWVCAQLANVVNDLEDRLRILDALYIPTRHTGSLPDRAPTDHFGRLQSDDALPHARALVDAIGDAPGAGLGGGAGGPRRLAGARGGVRQLRPGYRRSGQRSDLNLLLIDAAASEPQHERLPLSCSRPNRALPASSSGMPCGCGLGG